MCAFRIPHENFHLHQNYQDDDEHSGGRLLLDAIKRSEMMNRVIFVTRRYNGKHVGPSKFDAILDAAKAVVTEFPFNRLMQENQYLWTGDISLNDKEFHFQQICGRGGFRRGGTQGRGTNQRHNGRQDGPN